VSTRQPSLFDAVPAPVPLTVAEPPAPVVPAWPFEVKLSRSKRRRKTVGAQLRGGVLHVTVPSWMSKAEASKWAADMAAKFARQHTAAQVDLDERAAVLARRHHLPMPTTIRWASMISRWGSCTPATGAIRLSDRLAAFPPWVLDYVIVHELAHLRVADHSKAFWALVDRYPKAERAQGYLIAKSDDDDDPSL
jgi:predicted metal-dependent hydrolase